MENHSNNFTEIEIDGILHLLDDDLNIDESNSKEILIELEQKNTIIRLNTGDYFNLLFNKDEVYKLKKTQDYTGMPLYNIKKYLVKNLIDAEKIIKDLNAKNNKLKDDLSNLENLFIHSLISYYDIQDLLEHKKEELSSVKEKLNYYRKKEGKLKKKSNYIAEILNLRQEGLSYRKIANIYGVAPSTIHSWINKAQK